MTFTTHAIEDDAGNLHTRIKMTKTSNERRGAASHRMCINDEDYGQPQPLRHFSRAPAFGGSVEPIKQSHDAFNHRHFLVVSGPCEQGLVRLARKHPSVQIVRGNTGRKFIKSSVNEVRSDFEGLHSNSSTPQCG